MKDIPSAAWAADKIQEILDAVEPHDYWMMRHHDLVRTLRAHGFTVHGWEIILSDEEEEANDAK